MKEIKVSKELDQTGELSKFLQWFNIPYYWEIENGTTKYSFNKERIVATLDGDKRIYISEDEYIDYIHSSFNVPSSLMGEALSFIIQVTDLLKFWTNDLEYMANKYTFNKLTINSKGLVEANISQYFTLYLSIKYIKDYDWVTILEDVIRAGDRNVINFISATILLNDNQNDIRKLFHILKDADITSNYINFVVMGDNDVKMDVFDFHMDKLEREDGEEIDHLYSIYNIIDFIDNADYIQQRLKDHYSNIQGFNMYDEETRIKMVKELTARYYDIFYNVTIPYLSTSKDIPK